MSEKTLTPIKVLQKPDLHEWIPGAGEIFYQYDGENVKADYDNQLGKMDDISTLSTFYIKKNHYKARMPDIIQHMNYFTKFYDLDRDSFFAMMSMKYYIDTHLDMEQKDFVKMMLGRVITTSFISKCKMMSCDLYKLNINADTTGRFNNTPKITNAQAFQIVAVSFCFKIITPICLHFVNVNHNFDPSVKTEYLKWFTDLFNKAAKKFEVNDVKFYNALRKFIVFRGDKLYRNNATAFYQKKMLRGDTLEMYNENMLREVVMVKTLYKLDYRKSCVAFIDGVAHKFNVNYLKENFVSKPYEIDSEETSKDNDESLSHAEAMEMATYRRDESAAMVADINTGFVMNELREWYSAFEIPEEEFQFYYDNFHPNEVNQFLFNNYYSGKFKDPYAAINLNRIDVIYLLICMKKAFQRNKMFHLAQLCTAKVFTRYKDNMIKNSRFIERITGSPVYKEIISKKYANVMELGMKENPILKPLSNMVNCAYELVDYDPKINGYRLDHINMDAVANDYLLFMSII